MTRSDDTGKLVLRLGLGLVILVHGISKLSGGVGFVSGPSAQRDPCPVRQALLSPKSEELLGDLAYGR